MSEHTPRKKKQTGLTITSKKGEKKLNIQTNIVRFKKKNQNNIVSIRESSIFLWKLSHIFEFFDVQEESADDRCLI